MCAVLGVQGATLRRAKIDRMDSSSTSQVPLMGLFSAHFKFIRFLKYKSDAAKELRELVTEHIAPAGIKIGTVRTDGGGEFEGELQSLLKELDIKRETTPPHTPQYNGVVERALGLLRDKTAALLRGMTAGKSDRLWAEAMNYACKMSNRCTTTSPSRCLYIRTLGRTPADVRSPHSVWNCRTLTTTQTRAQVGAPRGQVNHARHQH